VSEFSRACPYCEGSGRVMADPLDWTSLKPRTLPCVECDGTGKLPADEDPVEAEHEADEFGFRERIRKAFGRPPI
jgi:hypothetical protein